MRIYRDEATEKNKEDELRIRQRFPLILIRSKNDHKLQLHVKALQQGQAGKKWPDILKPD